MSSLTSAGSCSTERFLNAQLKEQHNTGHAPGHYSGQIVRLHRVTYLAHYGGDIRLENVTSHQYLYWPHLLDESQKPNTSRTYCERISRVDELDRGVIDLSSCTPKCCFSLDGISTVV